MVGGDDVTTRVSVAMLNDIQWAFEDVCAQSDKALCTRILEMQANRYASEGKSLRRRCIQVSRKRRHRHDEDENMSPAVELRYVSRLRKRYVAVSCPWELPSSEGGVSGKYIIQKASDMMKTVVPQDVILDRVIRFCDNHHNLPFWIDKLCIEQQDGSDEKEIAIHSMDLIYKRSELTLGLLFVRIDSKEEMERLHNLLKGDCVLERQGGQSKTKYDLSIHLEQARDVLALLDRIVKDKWWERAWIFQEDYLSGLRMVLLIRSSQPHHLRSTCGFGEIPGELQVEAAQFRTEATRFCLALCDNASISEEERSLCAEILRRAGKYNILLARGNPKETLQAMSPTIFEDIGRRDISCISDILPIACNTCDYSESLDTQLLQQGESEGHHDKLSVSIAILTTYLLNGEIMRHEALCGKPSDTIFAFLKNNTLDIEPPVEEKELTFIKHCRFPSVILQKDGIQTEGIIWRLSKTIDTSPLSSHLQEKVFRHDQEVPEELERQYSWGRNRYQLGQRERSTLRLLACWLMDEEGLEYQEFAERLTDLLDKRIPEGFFGDWSWKHVVNMMATAVARAVKDGRQLRLGSVFNDKEAAPYTAIFVPPESSQRQDDSFAFTSWVPSKQVAQGDLFSSDCAKYASLEIEYQAPVSGLSHIVPKRWMNGLCFFLDADVTGVVIPWPKSLLNES